jgi:dihydropyrimidinase
MVMSRGTVLVAGREYHGRAGHGRFLPRGLSGYLR